MIKYEKNQFSDQIQIPSLIPMQLGNAKQFISLFRVSVLPHSKVEKNAYPKDSYKE